MRRMLMVLATAASMALLACGVAAAQTVSTNFEDLDLGTVNGQDGWRSAPSGGGGPSPTGEFDQEVVANSGAPDAFGLQSLRMSNRYVTGAFANQTYSAPVTPAVGEGLANTVYDAQFSFSSTSASEQPGLYMTISPDNGQGGRMSWVDLDDTPEGIAVNLSDASGPDGAFQTHPARVLSHGEPHTIRFWIKVNPGENDDFLRLFIDGEDLGECFTTWEEYYRNLAAPTEPPVINSVQFRLSFPPGGGPEALLGAGYLFDNVTATASPSTSTDCSPDGEDPDDGDGEPDVDVDKRTTTRFADPGDLITYRLTVRNRGDAAARDLRACDRAPRALRFVRASRRLQRAAGGRWCLTIRQLDPGERRSFRATFRLRAGVTADSVTNRASTTTSGPSAPYVTPPERPRARSRRRVHGRDAATIGVQDGPGVCAAALGPRARAAC